MSKDVFGRGNPYRVTDKLGRWTGYWRWYDETDSASPKRYRTEGAALLDLLRYAKSLEPPTLWGRLKAKVKDFWNDTRG